MPGEMSDFRLRDAIVRPGRGLIESGSAKTRLKPKAIDVLLALAERQGEVVSRTALLDAVWPGQAVSDEMLTTCLKELRKALGDDARSPTFIETVPRRGLRLAAPVLPLEAAPAARPRAPRRGSVTALIATLIMIVVLAAGTVLIGEPDERDAATTGVATEPNSLAVLPFVTMGSSPDDEYLADGLSEELINRLSRLDGLWVTARTSSFHFKGQNLDLRQVGRALSVRYVLEGSVRRSADALRVTAQLIDVGSGYHLWSDTYDRSKDDVFEIQDDIAESVAMALSVTLGVGELGAIEGGTRSADAFEAFLRASSAHRRFNAASLRIAIENYRRAVEIDPEFALAWLSLCNAYRTAWLTFGEDNADHWSALADDALAVAERLIPDSPALLSIQAYIHVDRGNWHEARRLYDQLRSTAPGKTPDSGYLDLLAKTGFADDALRIKERMRMLDPLNVDKAVYFGHLHHMRGEFDEALAELERAYALENHRAAISIEGLIVALTKRDPALVDVWLERASSYEQPGAKGVHRAMREQHLDRDKSLAYLAEGFEQRSIPDYFITVWAAYFGDHGLAQAALLRSPDPWVYWIPLVAPLRDRDEFAELMSATGLEAYWREHGWNDFCAPHGDGGFACDVR